MTTSDNPILYRIMDFFEFIALVNSAALRVSAASRFSDVNELVGAFLSTLEGPSFHPYTEQAMTELISQHQLSKQQFFVSSWTKSRDSIAMWELYSPDARGIQIGVRESAIKAAFCAYSREHSFVLGHNAPPDDGRILFYPAKSGLCEYVVFDEILEEVRTRYMALGAELQARVGDMDAFCKALGEFSENRILDPQNVLFLKDRAYRYEEEYRFTLRGVTRNSRFYDDCAKDTFFGLFDTHLRPVQKDDVGENIFIPFDASKVEEVWLDGRTPPWKQEVIKSLLEGCGLKSEVSSAYGSFFKVHEVKPMR